MTEAHTTVFSVQQTSFIYAGQERLELDEKYVLLLYENVQVSLTRKCCELSNQ